MPHISRLTISLGKPIRFKGQFTQHMVDVLANLPDTPRSPSPHLRNAIIKNRNLPGLGFLGNPPVESGIVNQHHRVDFVIEEILVGLGDQAKKEADVFEGIEKHHRHGG